MIQGERKTKTNRNTAKNDNNNNSSRDIQIVKSKLHKTDPPPNASLGTHIDAKVGNVLKTNNSQFNVHR